MPWLKASGHFYVRKDPKPDTQTSRLNVAQVPTADSVASTQQKAPVQDEGFCFQLSAGLGLIVAGALVVAVPPIRVACRYSITIQPSTAASVSAVGEERSAIPAIRAVTAIPTVITVAFAAFVSVAIAITAAAIVVLLATIAAVGFGAAAATAAISIPATAAAAAQATTASASASAYGVAATPAAAPTTAATTTTTAASTTVATATATDKRYDTGSGIAFQDRHRGCLCRPRYETCDK